MNCRRILIYILLSSPLLAYGFGKKTFVATRSQSVNAALELVGRQQLIHIPSDDCYGNFSAALAYTRSFHNSKLAKLLFGKESLTFSGSLVQDRAETDILADYFGLPFCYKSCVCFNPVVSNVIIDLDWYQSLSNVCEGLYCNIHAPIVHTKWDLHQHENILQDGSECPPYDFYPAGYMGPERIARSAMPRSVLDAFCGKLTEGDKEPLKFGKIFGRQVESRLSDVQVTLGYDFILRDDAHFGLNIRTSIPTGNRPKAEFLFEAIVGNGHHWELGAGLTGHTCLWQREDEYTQWDLYVDANITHLFSDTQKRSFDLKNNGTGSRYMLLQEFADGSTNLHVNGADAPNQYIGCILPAVNVTTFDVNVNIAVQADIVVKFAYQRASGFVFDIGYNFWGRSGEKICLDACSCTEFADNRFAIKGDAQVYGFDATDDAVRLNVSQHEATLYKAQGNGNFVAGSQFRNANADDPVGADDANDNALQQLNNADAATLSIAQAQINTSNPAQLLTKADINIVSATLPKAIAHKLFFHVGHTWFEMERITPYLGTGFATEWACRCFKNNSAFSQWSMWLKGGFSY